ncbi:hypothetical protein [Pacificoceanicola onchidii]|uniref:hypothetical protein n=1 Tax=Pacificoceanicola onchidii TaxID=2562685 RepID=UPI0010A6919D|nr:hypothetical protein [Pacificoceanicola onchidii]
MAIILSIHPNRDLALFQFEGTVDTKQGARIFQDYVSAPGFSPTYKMLTDTSRLDTVESNYRSMLSGVLSLRESLSKFDTPALSVIYARSNFFFGMARLLEQVQNPLSNIQIVVTRDEAEALTLAGQPEKSMADLHEALRRETDPGGALHVVDNQESAKKPPSTED